jgi:hypothetical protein
MPGPAKEGSPPAPRFENAATRSMRRFKDAIEACDWERVAAVLAPEFRYSDRRKMMHLDLDRERYIEFLRPNWQMSSAGVTDELLATRGDRLALFRALFEGSDRTIGPSEIEALCAARRHTSRFAPTTSAYTSAGSSSLRR